MANRWCTFTIILVLMTSNFGQSKGVAISNKENDEIYQIDYRGPETHSSFPPPELSRTDPKPKPGTKHSAHKARKMNRG